MDMYACTKSRKHYFIEREIAVGSFLILKRIVLGSVLLNIVSWRVRAHKTIAQYIRIRMGKVHDQRSSESV